MTDHPGATVLLTFYLQNSAPEGYKGIGELRDLGIEELGDLSIVNYCSLV